jgi:translation initiation factor 1 (eIF-1/SUI1)
MIKELLEGKLVRETSEFNQMMDAETGGRHITGKIVATVNGVEFDEKELNDMASDFGIRIGGKTWEQIAKEIEVEIKKSEGD